MKTQRLITGTDRLRFAGRVNRLLIAGGTVVPTTMCIAVSSGTTLSGGSNQSVFSVVIEGEDVIFNDMNFD